jgi:hypothetical protein
MAAGAAFPELVGHLERTTRLTRSEAEWIVAEVLAYFSESLEAFVTRRHGELQGEELKNPDIFTRIIGELSERRFAAASITERQIRRIVYG